MANAPSPKKAKPAAKSPAARTKAAGKTASTKKPQVKPSPSEPATLEPRQQRFVDEYLIDLNATQAAIRAGYSEGSARQMGAENLSKPYIQAAIAQAQKDRAERTGITAERALSEVWKIATADPRELVQVRVGCCRHCYGEGHKYQRTVGEMNADKEKHAAAGKDLADFDEQGGIGFNPLLPPLPECTECGGDGQARTVLADTRALTPAAQALYAGAKQTKYGIEVLMHSKMDAMEKVFKHLGLYKEDNTQKTDALATLLHTIASGNSSTFKPVKDDPAHKGA